MKTRSRNESRHTTRGVWVAAAVLVLVATPAAPVRAAPTAEDDGFYKTPFTRLLELPGRAIGGVGYVAGRTWDAMGEALDGARSVRDEIYHDGLEKFVDRRMQSMADGVMSKFEGILLTASDLGGGRIARVADDPDQADEAWRARGRAAERAREGLRSLDRTINPLLARTNEAVEILSDSDPFERTLLLGKWLDMSARSLAAQTSKTLRNATKKDLQARVKQQMRERIQKLPPDSWHRANSLLDLVVSRAVDATFTGAESGVRRTVDRTARRPAPPPPASRPHVQLSGAARWSKGDGNRFCTIAGTIDVATQRFNGKALHGVFQKMPGQTFSGEFQGDYQGDAVQGTLRGSGVVTVRWRDKETGRPQSDQFRYVLNATLAGGVVQGHLSAKNKILHRFSLPVR